MLHEHFNNRFCNNSEIDFGSDHWLRWHLEYKTACLTALSITCLFTCLTTYLNAHRHVYSVDVHMSLHISICMSAHMSMHRCMHMSMPMSMRGQMADIGCKDATLLQQPQSDLVKLVTRQKRNCLRSRTLLRQYEDLLRRSSSSRD